MLEIVTPATSDALTTLGYARLELGGATALTDGQVERLIAQASAVCARFCDRTTFGFEEVRQTERVRDWRDPWPAGDASAGIVLARDLAPEIVSVTDGDTLLDTGDWMLDGAILHRINGGVCYGWRWGGPVVIEYAAGYDLPDDVPPDVERACLLTIRAWHYATGRDPYLRSETAEGVGSVAYATAPAVAGGSLPAEAAAMLRPWRRMGGF